MTKDPSEGICTMAAPVRTSAMRLYVNSKQELRDHDFIHDFLLIVIGMLAIMLVGKSLSNEPCLHLLDTSSKGGAQAQVYIYNGPYELLQRIHSSIGKAVVGC